MEWYKFVLLIISVGLVQFAISHFVNKGKNLATKEDISKITKQIESVKEYYNKSLEEYKIDLQKEFEHHKYILNLCQSLDDKLISCISRCLKAKISNEFNYPQNDNDLVVENKKLASFMNTYKNRYKYDKTLSKLCDISTKINTLLEVGDLEKSEYDGKIYCEIPVSDKKNLLSLLNKSLAIFLPPLKTDMPEK